MSLTTTSYNPLVIQPVANGFIIRGEVEFQTMRASNEPIEWHVFESSFDGAMAYLRTRYVIAAVVK